MFGLGSTEMIIVFIIVIAIFLVRKISIKKGIYSILFILGILSVVGGFILNAEAERRRNNYYDRASEFINGNSNYGQELSQMSTFAGVLIIIGGGIALFGLFKLVFSKSSSQDSKIETSVKQNPPSNKKQNLYPENDRLYFYNDGSNQFGPFKLEEIRNKALSSEYHIWYEGLSEWKKATEIWELEGFLKITPPPFNKNV